VTTCPQTTHWRIAKGPPRPARSSVSDSRDKRRDRGGQIFTLAFA
jgi:hypothetical protein